MPPAPPIPLELELELDDEELDDDAVVPLLVVPSLLELHAKSERERPRTT
jgi:hypothetical protein